MHLNKATKDYLDIQCNVSKTDLSEINKKFKTL